MPLVKRPHLSQATVSLRLSWADYNTLREIVRTMPVIPGLNSPERFWLWWLDRTGDRVPSTTPAEEVPGDLG